MKKVQFLTNGKVVTYIDVSSTTYSEEERQLINQGFVLSGDIVETNNIEEVLNVYRNNYGKEFKEYSVIALMSGVASIL